MRPLALVALALALALAGCRSVVDLTPPDAAGVDANFVDAHDLIDAGGDGPSASDATPGPIDAR